MAAKKAKTTKKSTKKEAPAKETKTKKETAKKEAADKPKFDVNYIAEQMGLEPFTIRQKLRKAGIEKAGRSYGWNTKKEVDEVIKTLKATKLKNEE